MRFGHRKPLAAILAIAAVAALGAGVIHAIRPTPLERLMKASAQPGRRIAGRLSGDLPWAPFRVVRGEPRVDADTADLFAAASELVREAKEDPSSEAAHGSALAHLLTGNTQKAVDTLSRVAASSRTAAMWSDLAAATHFTVSEGGSAGQLIDALVAADAALKIDDRFPQARFNRALILESLGLRELALEQWRQYLEVDTGSAWGVEARAHIDALSRTPPDFRSTLEREYDRIPASPGVAADLARRFPQEVRTWSETEILGRWADAEKKGDGANAERHLRVARAFAPLVRRRGDVMLARAVDAIDRATPAQRHSLVAAHLAFRKAQRAFLDMKPSEAETLFTKAVDEFGAGGSPLELLARYFRANTAYEQGRVDEAADALEKLSRTGEGNLRSFHAQVSWELGLCRSAKGRLGEAITCFTNSMKTFEELGEAGNATAMRGMLASVFDLIGDSESAWNFRALSLRQLGQKVTARLQSSLGSLGTIAILRRDWPAAASVLRLELDAARIAGSEVFMADAQLRRALVFHHLGDETAARSALAGARAHTRQIQDVGYRSQYEARLLWIEGTLAPSAAEAVAVLTRAVGYNETAGRKALLPSVLLARAHAYRANGDPAAAAADLERAVLELEAHRESLPQGDRRWGVFHASTEIFDAAIDLALKNGDVSRAFHYAERARARVLLDTWKAPVAAAPEAIPPSSTLVEYHIADDRIDFFVVSASSVRSRSRSLDRSALGADIERLVDAIARGNEADIRRTSRLLHRVLIEPVESLVGPNDTLVIVPDAAVSAVPFAALMADDGTFLVERHPIVVSPSAAVFSHLSKKEGSHDRELLLVVSAQAEGLPPLTEALTEEQALGRFYGRVTLLDGNAATANAFRDAARTASRIHFSGHAIASETTAAETSLLLADRMDVKSIAAIQLDRAPIVILAACSTARGRVTPLEGTMSVARAFLAAGSRSVLATLWPIEDREAAKFFERVHERLARGEAAADALRGAQIDSIRSSVSPSMWAAVQTIGS